MKLIVGLGNPGDRYQRSRHNVGFFVLDFLFGSRTRLIHADGEPIRADKIGGNQLVNQRKSALAWRFNKRTECAEAAVALADDQRIIMAKPQTMMNASGRAVKKLLAFYPSTSPPRADGAGFRLPEKATGFSSGRLHKVALKDLLVVHDDLDLKLGEFKLQFAKGPRVHNGVNSVEKTLGTKNFWRLRVGIDNRHPAKRIPGEEYVLQGFTAVEKRALGALIEDKLLSQITVWTTHSSPTPPRENPSG